MVAVRPQGDARAGGPVGRRVRRGVPGRRGRREGEEGRARAGAVRAHDADAGADRQRLDDLLRHREPDLEPDGAPRERHPPLEPVHRDPRGDERLRDGRVQPRFGEPRRALLDRGIRLRAARNDRGDGRQVPRPHHRPRLLPDRRGREGEPQVASDRPGLHGPRRRVLQAEARLRLRRGAEALDGDQRAHRDRGVRDLREARGRARGAPELRRDPRRRGRAPRWTTTRTPESPWAGAGTRCAPRSASTACATRS